MATDRIEKKKRFITTFKYLFKNMDNIFTFLNSKNLNSLPQSTLYTGNFSEEADKTVKLDASLKAQFDRAFNFDFSDVKIHTGHYSNEIARSSGADAVTFGTDIYFANGKYAPDTEEGISLLAHELQHVIQFKRGERMKYHEDITSLENQADSVENRLEDMRLHNIASPLLADSVIPEIHPEQSSSDSYVALHKKYSSSISQEFTGRDDRKIYKILLSNGQKAMFDEQGINEIIDTARQRVEETIMDMRHVLTEEKSEKLLLRFYELIRSRI